MPESDGETFLPIVRQQLQRFTDGLTAILCDNLVGIYLHGSLALGSFQLHRSDLDLLVITEERLTVSSRRELAELLLMLSRRPSPIEVSFLSCAMLSPWRYPTLYDLHFSEEWRSRFEELLQHDSWPESDAPPATDADLASHITLLTRRGISLYGPPVAAVFPLVPAPDFLDSVLRDVLDPDCGLPAIAREPVYVVLNACRTWSYLCTGAIQSKVEGGEWALTHLPTHLHEPVRSALAAYRNPAHPITTCEPALAAFAAFMEVQLARLHAFPPQEIR